MRAAKDEREEKERQGPNSHSTPGSTPPPVRTETLLELGQCQHTHTHKTKAGSTKSKNCTKLPVQHVLCSGGSSGCSSTPGITKHWLCIVDPPSQSMNSLAVFLPVNKEGPEHPAAHAAPHQHASWHSFGLCQLLVSQTSPTHHFGDGTGWGLSLPASDYIHIGFESGKRGKGKT